MPYALIDVELTEPLDEILVGERESGLGIISRRHGRVVGFSLHAVAPGTRVSDGQVAAMLDPSPVEAVEPTDAPGSDRRHTSITVAVCTKDRPDLLRTCLDSVLDGEAQPHEILVVDNAPSDRRTQDLVRALGERYVCEPCAGLDFARNRALRSASGDVVAFIDDDDVVVDPDWLASIEAVWREEPDTGALTGQILPLELATDAQVAFERRGGFRGGNKRVRYSVTSRVGDPVYPYGPGMFGAGANMAVHRETALQLGAFDEALDTGAPLPGGGDIDMMHRIVRHGHALVYEPRAVVFHRHRRQTEELLRQYRSWGRSTMAFVVKTYHDDPAGRRKLRRFVRWFFAAQGRAVVRGDPDERRAARHEMIGGVVGLLGTYERSRRRSARVRRMCAGPTVAVMAPTDESGATVVTETCRRVAEAVARAGADPMIVAWSSHVSRPVKRIDVPTGATLYLVPAEPPSGRPRWWFDEPTRSLTRVLRDSGSRVVLCLREVEEARRVGVAAVIAGSAVFTVGDAENALERWHRPAPVAMTRIGVRHVAVLDALHDELGRVGIST
jgi:glycosyltransferase involved in cell wall biosynthesis